MNRDIVNQSISCLHRKGFWFFDLHKKLEALDTISRYGQVGDIRYVFYFVFNERKRISLKAAEVINALLAKIKPQEWNCLYNSVRSESIYNHQIRKFRKQFPEEEAISLLGMASLNGDGYIRQAALKELAKFQNGKIIPFVLLRLADWVEVVRKEADAILNQLLQSEYAHSFWEYHFFYDWMQRIERVDLRPVLDRIYCCMSNSLARDDIEEHLNQYDQSRRLAYYKILAINRESHVHLFNLIRKELSPSIRLWYVRHILDATAKSIV